MEPLSPQLTQACRGRGREGAGKRGREGASLYPSLAKGLFKLSKGGLIGILDNNGLLTYSSHDKLLLPGRL